MRNLRVRWSSISAAVALALGVVGIARAGTINVVTAIKTQDALVRKTHDYEVFSRNLNVKTVSAAKRVVPVIGPLEKASAKAVRAVAQASTSSAQQQQGKTDWVKGSEEDDRGILEYRSALRDLIAGHRSAFQTQDAKAQKLIGEGVTLSAKGDKRLGISIND